MTSATKQQPGAPKSAKYAAGALVKIKPVLPDSPETTGEKSAYWIGVVSTCPIQNLVIWKYTFQLFGGSTDFDDNGKPTSRVPNGTVVNMTDAEVDALVAMIAVMAFRFLGTSSADFTDPDTAPIERRRAILLPNIGAKSYQRQQSDRPLAEFVYMKGYDGVENRDGVFPESMMET